MPICIENANNIGCLINADKGGNQQTTLKLISGVLLTVHIPMHGYPENKMIYLEMLDNLAKRKIGTIIRVGKRLYPDRSAEQHGITCVSCEFDQQTPSPGVVTAFLYTLRTSKAGGVAVHSDGSKGRAATLCALHLMHAHGFSAAEATTWLRIICPSLRMKRRQEDFLRAVGSELEADAGGREEAFRRGVFRAWAANELRSGWYRRRPESGYDVASADDDKLERLKTALEGCANFQPTAETLNLATRWLICCELGPGEKDEMVSVVPASILPEQCWMKTI